MKVDVAPILPAATALRRALHSAPDTAHNESLTANRIIDWLTERGVLPVATDIGKQKGGRDSCGLLFTVVGRQATDAGANKTRTNVLFRCELDALPVAEGNEGLAWRSQRPTEAAHLCGHDGHAAALCAALALLQEHSDQWSGVVHAVFQPAEETGEGGASVASDPRILHLRNGDLSVRSSATVDGVGVGDDVGVVHGNIARTLSDLPPLMAFAVHNVPGPGHPLGVVRIRNGPMSMGSTGLRLQLVGATSHASNPSAGRNPVPALSRLALGMDDLLALHKQEADDALALISIVHVRAAASARYGTCAGEGEICLTVRASTAASLDGLTQRIMRFAEAEARADSLELLELQRIDPFPASENEAYAVSCVRAAAKHAGLECVDLPIPYPWSEDFGHFGSYFPCALIGLGAGETHAELHAPDYDYPDELLNAAVRLWVSLVGYAHE